MPKSACEQVITASSKGWWCCGSCWCHLFVSRFELEFLPKRPPKDPLKAFRKVPDEDKWKKREGLPPVGQGIEGNTSSQLVSTAWATSFFDLMGKSLMMIVKRL